MKTKQTGSYKKLKPIEESVNGNGFVELQGVEGEELATFGAGCYWGTEKYYAINYEKNKPGSMLGYSVGFMSPTPEIKAPENPTYKEVCSKTTSHVEVLQIRFNNKVTTYEELVKFLFTFHDPTTFNRQKQDKGPQYASTIMYHSEQ